MGSGMTCLSIDGTTWVSARMYIDFPEVVTSVAQVNLQPDSQFAARVSHLSLSTCVRGVTSAVSNSLNSVL